MRAKVCAVHCRWMLLALVGCAPTEISIRTIGETSKVDARAETSPVGTCAPTKRVRVLSAAGMPVEGAAVVVRMRVHTNCPSVGPITQLYSTDALHTDSQGLVTTCDPDSFFRDEQLSICRTRSEGATVVVSASDQAAELSPPFAAELSAVLTPCAKLLARDPRFATCVEHAPAIR